MSVQLQGKCTFSQIIESIPLKHIRWIWGQVQVGNSGNTVLFPLACCESKHSLNYVLTTDLGWCEGDACKSIHWEKEKQIQTNVVHRVISVMLPINPPLTSPHCSPCITVTALQPTMTHICHPLTEITTASIQEQYKENYPWIAWLSSLILSGYCCF